MKKFVIVFVFFTLFFGMMSYLSGVYEPLEALPIILGGSFIIALLWILSGWLLKDVSKPKKDK